MLRTREKYSGRMIRSYPDGTGVKAHRAETRSQLGRSRLTYDSEHPLAGPMLEAIASRMTRRLAARLKPQATNRWYRKKTDREACSRLLSVQSNSLFGCLLRTPLVSARSAFCLIRLVLSMVRCGAIKSIQTIQVAFGASRISPSICARPARIAEYPPLPNTLSGKSFACSDSKR